MNHSDFISKKQLEEMDWCCIGAFRTCWARDSRARVWYWETWSL